MNRKKGEIRNAEWLAVGGRIRRYFLTYSRVKRANLLLEEDKKEMKLSESEKEQIRKAELLAVGEACESYFLTYARVKRENL